MPVNLKTPKKGPSSGMHQGEIVAPAASQRAKNLAKLAKMTQRDKNGKLPPYNAKMPLSRVNAKIDIDKAIQMRLHGATYQEIADRFDCAKASVCEKINRYLPGDIDINAYRNHRLNIFANLEARLLQTLSDKEIKKRMSPAQRVMSAGLLYDKQRVEQGQPNTILGSVNLTPEVIEALTKMRETETDQALKMACKSEAARDEEDY